MSLFFNNTADGQTGETNDIFGTIVDGINDFFTSKQQADAEQSQRNFLQDLVRSGAIPFSAFGFSGGSGTGAVSDGFTDGEGGLNYQAIGVLIAFVGLVIAAFTFFRK